MRNRLELHEKLCDLLGSRHVYYQPPESLKLVYPCIIYEKSDKDYTHADDLKYLISQKYTLTFITKDPDSDVPNKIEELNYSSYSKRYVADNLYHDVYQIYY